MCPASDLQASRILPMVAYLLAAGTLWTTRARGSKHTGDGNQFMGMVELPEGAIVELELSINKKPTNMQSKVLMEAKLVE